jgi:hypothetical protein
MTQDQKNKLDQLLGTLQSILIEVEEVATTIEDILND